MKMLLPCTLLAGLVAGQASALAENLNVVSWGGNFQENQRTIYFEPFSKETGIKLTEDSYQGGWDQFQAMLDSGNISWDVVEVETAELARGCESGLFRKLDWQRLGSAKDYIPGGASSCGLGAVGMSYGLVYNDTTAGESKPNGAADFFDLERWPGKRAVRGGPKFNLEFALMADGVPPSEVYKVMATDAGIDRAFAKLDAIKSNLLFYEATGQGLDWLVNGEAKLALSYNGRVFQQVQEGKPLHIIWDKSVYLLDSWVVLKRDGNEESAYKLLGALGNPKGQAAFSIATGYGPARNDALEGVPAAMHPYLPAGPNLERGLNSSSDEAASFWLDHLEDLTARWNGWAAK